MAPRLCPLPSPHFGLHPSAAEAVPSSCAVSGNHGPTGAICGGEEGCPAAKEHGGGGLCLEEMRESHAREFWAD